jgi:predicted ATPase
MVKSGSPVEGETAFKLDPDIKAESVRLHGSRRTALMQREGAKVSISDGEGRMMRHDSPLLPSESLLAQLQEPQAYPELHALQQEMARWRFYHQFRTDPDSPLRYPQVGVRTPVLAHDGRDLAAALQTIIEIGDERELRDAVNRAYPGGCVEIRLDRDRALFSVALRMPGILRPFAAGELSDGTLRYLCLVAALLSPRPPALMALNEPETSLHPDLIPALAGLIATASRNSQLWITTHSRPLAEAIRQQTGESPVELELRNGETLVKGRGMVWAD